MGIARRAIDGNRTSTHFAFEKIKWKTSGRENRLGAPGRGRFL
jgi:hypothetical protein